MTATQIRPATRLSPLVAAIRTAVQSHADWAETAQLVADELRRHLPTPDVLTASQRLGSPDDYCAHNLYVEPDGSFSTSPASVRAPAATTTDLDRDHTRNQLPPTTKGAPTMSLARAQFFSISLDGFGTGEGLSHDTPFGHAGERLHGWMFVTRWWREMSGQPGGSGGIDDTFLQQHDHRIGAEIM